MNISNTYSSKASSSKGFSGIASGMDTDSMVEAMLAGTQAKIDKQQGLKQQALWKQELYREIITQINAFQSKFFSTTSGTNLLSRSFYNLMSATSATSAFKVSATSSAPAGATKIKVERLATNTKLTSGSAVSGKLAGNVDAAALKALVDGELAASRNLVLTVDGRDVTVDLGDVFVQDGAFTAYSDAQKADLIKDKINAQLAADGVTTASASVRDGVLTLTSTDAEKTVKVSADSDAAALKALGLSAGKVTSGSGTVLTLSSTMSLKSTFDLDVTLDDSKKTLRLEMRRFVTESGGIDLDGFRQALQDEADRTHGAGQIAVALNGNSLELGVAPGRKVLVGGSQEALKAAGFKNGQSNKIGMGGSLRDLYFANGLSGSQFKFTINGVAFTFDDTNNMTEVINKINASDAGVRVVYKSLEDRFVMESTNSGQGFGIQMTQEEGSLLSAMFGAGPDGALATGGSAVSKELFAARIGASPVLDDGDFDVREGTFQIKVDGQTYTLSAPRKEDGGAYGKAELLTLFNHQLEEKLGAGTVEFAADGSLIVQGGAKVEIAKSAHADLTDPDLIKEAAKTDLALALGFAQGADNRTTADTALADLGISIPGCTTLGDLSGNLAFVDGRVVVTGTGITVVGDAATTEKLFGRPSLELGMTQGAAAAYVEGVNAVLYVDGDENRTERSSNSFTINGLNIELKETTDDYQVVNVSRGTDQIVDGIKGFMEEYNTLIEKLNGLIREEATYKSYAPLTSDQKKEMSDREVELWEQQAKTGLLRRDSAIESFLQSMRTAIYAKPTGSDIAIYDLGISTSSEWQDFGKLVLTADGEAKLRQMVESDPDAVVNLFTGEEGLAVRMDGILKSAANTSSASPGSLIRLAGWPGRASATDNDLYKRMQQIDDRIAALKRTYEKEKSRYWRQFNAMEQVVANMTSQSAWLTQQLGM